MNATNQLSEIKDFLDVELKIHEHKDYPNAVNGLQVQNNGTVSSIATAVDASEQAITQAIEMGADLLIVHHGLFWSGLQPIIDGMWKKIDMAIKNNLAIYSAHLPLDNHPVHGNNAQLAFKCGMEHTGEGLPYLDGHLGIQTRFKGTCAELVKKIKQATRHHIDAYLQTAPEENPGKILVCTGGAGDEIQNVAAMGVQTYITGEASHWAIPAAAELGVNLILAGHYATETFGVKALGEALHNKFGYPSTFIDLPPSAYGAFHTHL